MFGRNTIANKQVSRRLAAVMAADVAGYTGLMESDETGTLSELMRRHRDIFAPLVKQHGGRIVKLMGDGALVEFGSVVEAVNCAIALQNGFAQENITRAHLPPMLLRIGVNIGDIIIEGQDIFGDGVNLAARLQGCAEPGQIALCAAGHAQSHKRVAHVFTDAGFKEFKNVVDPVRVYIWNDSSTIAPLPLQSLQVPEKPSVAVLPFDNMSGDPARDYFADGIVEALTAALSRIRSFFVIARNSAFAYKGQATNVQKIGRELGVAYLLEGSVQQAGDQVRITVQLIETKGGAHLWAERFDGQMSEIFELQDRITEQVAGALQPSIRQAEIDRARRKPTQDLGAYDFTMRAMGSVWKLEKDAATEALDLLEKALEADPEYPLANALAAWCWAQRSVYNWHDDITETKRKALAYAERAANLSSDDPLILAVLGAVHTFARNYGAARVMLERAIALDPNSAWALSRLGWLEVYADRTDAALQYFNRALRLSPLDPLNFNTYVGMASAYQTAGDDQNAANLFKRALEERPNASWIHRNLGPALLSIGDREGAEESYEILMQAYPNFTIERFREAMVFSEQLMARICAQLEKLGVPRS